MPNSDNAGWDIVQTQPIEAIAQPGESYTFNEISRAGKKKVLTEVTTNVVFYPFSAVLIANRIQLDGRKGYWLVIPTNTNRGRLFVAVGFAKDEVTAEAVLAAVIKPPEVVLSHSALSTGTPVQGRYIPSEAPEQQIVAGGYSSLSVAQLINLTDEVQPLKSNTYTGALVLTHANQFSSRFNLETITIGLAKSETQLNWLSAFYAIEWTVFALFALFIWWRLLSDAYLKQQSKIGS